MTSATAIVYRSVYTDRWMVAFTHGEMIEHVDLAEYAPGIAYDVDSGWLEPGPLAAAFWVLQQGVYLLGCPQCGVGPGKRCVKLFDCTVPTHARRIRQITSPDDDFRKLILTQARLKVT